MYCFYLFFIHILSRSIHTYKLLSKRHKRRKKMFFCWPRKAFNFFSTERVHCLTPVAALCEETAVGGETFSWNICTTFMLVFQIVLNRSLLHVSSQRDICLTTEDFRLVRLKTAPLKILARISIFLKALSEVIGLAIYAFALIC